MTIVLGDLLLDVQFKNIKNVHLSVHPPEGRVTIAAPERMTLDLVRAYAVTKLAWIRSRQRKLRDAQRAPRAEFLERESHYVWGQRYLLHLDGTPSREKVVVSAHRLTLHVATSDSDEAKAAVLARWYRERIYAEAPAIAERWAKLLRVKVPPVRVRRMKTKWGSCSRQTGAILLNTELAKKPKECLEYIVLHEMAHLIERTHNAKFTTIMDRAMPTWRTRRDRLNQLPV
jgi:predicted metal-dependent hydrolase